jgi:hypothetical protein
MHGEGAIVRVPTKPAQGARSAFASGGRREVLLMRSSVARSFLSMAAWFYLGPFVAIGVLALLVLGFGALAVAVQLLAVFLKHVGI